VQGANTQLGVTVDLLPGLAAIGTEEVIDLAAVNMAFDKLAHIAAVADDIAVMALGRQNEIMAGRILRSSGP